MLIKTARLIIVIAASLFLLFASVQLLYAQSDVRPPVPVVYEQDENRYSLDYFLPYAKSILVNHTYRNGGGILAVVPGVMGIAAFSPPLDPVGNSVRGQKMVASVAQQLGYNLYKSR